MSVIALNLSSLGQQGRSIYIPLVFGVWRTADRETRGHGLLGERDSKGMLRQPTFFRPGSMSEYV